MPKKNWTIELDNTEYLIELHHNPWTNIRKIWVDGKLEINEKKKGILDVGDIYPIEFKDHLLHVAIFVDESSLVDQGYLYDLYVDQSSISTGEPLDLDFEKEYVEGYQELTNRRLKVIGISFIILIIIFIIYFLQ